jgi:hypothetical protein
MKRKLFVWNLNERGEKKERGRKEEKGEREGEKRRGREKREEKKNERGEKKERERKKNVLNTTNITFIYQSTHTNTYLLSPPIFNKANIASAFFDCSSLSNESNVKLNSPVRSASLSRSRSKIQTARMREDIASRHWLTTLRSSLLAPYK